MPENEEPKRHPDALRHRVLLAAACGAEDAAGMREWMASGGYAPVVVHDLAEALARAAAGEARVAVVDMRTAAENGMDDLHRLVTMQPRLCCILAASPEAVPGAVDILRRGAFACLRQPVVREELLAMLARCFETLQLVNDRDKAEAAQAALVRELGGETRRANQALAALERTEREYRHLVHSLPEVFYRTDPAGVITMISPSVTPVLGYPADEVVGMDMARDIYLDRGDREGLLKTLESTGTVEGDEVFLKHSDGRPVLVSATHQLVRDPDGRIRGVEGLFKDITRRRRIEEERTRLATAVDQASELIFITDTEGVIQYVNPSFEEVTGYAREEVIGRKPSLLKSGKHDDAFYRGMWATITGGSVWRGQILNRKKDGTLYEEEASITPIRDHIGRVVSFVAVKRDVTREVRLTKQLRQAQKMEAIGTLAGGIAHDFNNILAAIIGYAELARLDLIEGTPLMENIGKVLDASYRARDLVSQILAFSRQTEQELKPVSIGSIVKEVLKLLRASLPATIEIRQRVTLEQATILADATQIHQVLMNICANAGHAMRVHGGVLEVYLGEPRGDYAPPLSLQHLRVEDYLCLGIRDTGHGMPPEVLERIFDPYFTTKKKEEGTGLGLAMVHGIVTSHNGHITVESTPGEGTTFKIYFPKLPVKIFDRRKTLGAKLPGGSERVMLIDDEVDLVQVNRKMLERLGYQVEAHTDSRAALDAFETDPGRIDLLITDMTMPGLTGDQVVRAVHARRPELPIIMCTGFSEVVTRETAQELGVRKLMMKPLSVGDLARTIRELLD